jgi:hypothetical protein
VGFVVVLQPEINNEIETGMKQRILHNARHIIYIYVVVMAATFTGCSNNKHPFVFHTPQEAVVACHEELAKVKMMNSANIDELAQVINTWTELQDSTMSIMMQDSAMTVHNDLASEFFAVADSFRMEITDLALAQKRSMGDVMKLKVATSSNRKAALASEEFKSVRQYYMDFNRRIIQSAENCKNDINAKKPLTAKQGANYRWLLIQPFLALDNYATAALTEQQIKTLTQLAEELPRLLAYVDGKDYDRSPKEETEKLSTVLSEYFLKSYLKSIL